ncbi:hypothetical protein AMATHDRAFT_8339 [Amanita thiersii Skay4041]|uniref:Ig-like domain-containing protein n=1 Tax=Amanita thiersii Skay4041 TaxID=703135 RepID=A0A2A9N8D6_9AGAR|nr:hypothetical protein AMATHDRAFT_8339 [Amanita thiersii Skay4041]
MLKQLNKTTTTFKQSLNSSTAKKPLAATSSNKENVGKRPLSQVAAIRRAQLKKPLAPSSKAGTGIGSVNKPVKAKGSNVKRQALAELPIASIKRLKAPVKASGASTAVVGPRDEDWAAGLDEASVSTPLKKRSIVNRPLAPSPKFDISLPEIPIVSCSEVGSKPPLPCPNFPLLDSTVPAVSSANREVVAQADTSCDSTVAIERDLNKFSNLKDISLKSLEAVKIDYSLEFPTGDAARVPPFRVVHYVSIQRRLQRAAQAEEAEKRKESESKKSSNSEPPCQVETDTISCSESESLDRLLQDNCIIDLPIHVLSPTFNWPVMEPEQYIPRTGTPQKSSLAIPTVIVTSPKDGGSISCVPTEAEINFDVQDLVSKVYKNYPLNAPLHNWNMRFNLSAMFSTDEVVESGETESTDSLDTGASGEVPAGDVSMEVLFDANDLKNRLITDFPETPRLSRVYKAH